MIFIPVPRNWKTWTLAAAASAMLGACASGPTPKAGSQPAPATFVLVHGALFTGAGWAPLESQLRAAGHRAVSFDVPGRTEAEAKTVDLNVAAAKVCAVVNAQDDRVVLVGHSQGGALITQATAGCGDKIRALVYVAALVPQNGAPAFADLTPETQEAFGQAATPDPEAGIFRLNRKGPLENLFFQDLRAQDAALADSVLAGMVSEPLGIGGTPAAYDSDRFAAFPKYYVKTTQDRVVVPDNQQLFLDRTPMKRVFTLDTGHCPFLSKPQDLATILAEVQVDVADSM